MTGVYILSGILLVAFIGMTCTMIDIIKDVASDDVVITRKKINKPKPVEFVLEDNIEIDTELFDDN